MRNLFELDLSGNKLSGCIPADMQVRLSINDAAFSCSVVWLVCNTLMLLEALSHHHQLHWSCILSPSYIDQAFKFVVIASCQIFRYCRYCSARNACHIMASRRAVNPEPLLSAELNLIRHESR